MVCKVCFFILFYIIEVISNILLIRGLGSSVLVIVVGIEFVN